MILKQAGSYLYDIVMDKGPCKDKTKKEDRMTCAIQKAEGDVYRTLVQDLTEYLSNCGDSCKICASAKDE